MDIDGAIALIRHRAGSDVTARLLASVATDEVLVVSGSLIEGLGNLRSDLDFFALSTSHPRDVPVRMAFAGDSWVDIEYVTPSAIDKLAGKLAAVDPKNIAQVLHLTHKELDRFYRLSIGVAVRGSADMSSRLPLDIFRALLKPWALVHAGAFAARASIALAYGDLTAAVLYASHAAHFCAEGALTDVGECYPSLKYTLEKAIRAYGADSPEVCATRSLLHPSGDLAHYVVAVTEHVDNTLAGCLSRVDSGESRAVPIAPLAYSTHFRTPAVLARKTAYDVLPEDTAVVGSLLSLPGLVSQAAAPGQMPSGSTWRDEAHRLVLQEALIDAGLLTREGDQW